MDQATLFRQLNSLADRADVFYSVDQIGHDGGLYRIFLYRLASYTDFLLPAGEESRGSMFRNIADPAVQLNDPDYLDSDPKNWQLVSLPMEKFFNMGENPITIGLDYSKALYSMVKEDGSLISTYTGQDGKLYLKTKGSLHSDQAIAAMDWIRHPDNRAYHHKIAQLDSEGWTVNLEWTSPLNRIVVPYQEDKLIVLNARSRHTGEYMARQALQDIFGEFVVPVLDIPVHEVAAMEKGEGIVVFFGNEASPRMVKVKADAYLVLHRLKDGVNQPNALFEAVVHGAVDDLRASFADDPAVQTMISVMEKLVRDAFRQFTAAIVTLFLAHRDLDRKSFAIRMQEATKELIPLDAGAAFNVLMNKYLQRDERLIDSFVKSAQGRVVAEYKQKVTELLGAAPTETGE